MPQWDWHLLGGLLGPSKVPPLWEPPELCAGAGPGAGLAAIAFIEDMAAAGEDAFEPPPML